MRMVDFLKSFLLLSFVMSAIILGMLLFNAMFPKLIQPKWKYVSWIIVLLGLAIPFRPMIGEGIFQFQPYLQFEEQTDVLETGHDKSLAGGAVQNPRNELLLESNMSTVGQKSSLPIASVWIWATVAIGIFMLHIVRYIRFIRCIKRWGTPVCDGKIISAYQIAKNETRIKNVNIQLMTCAFVSSSMLTGFFRPVILLPDKNFSMDELILIFKHELIHYKRYDLLVNLICIVVLALHWFNPLVQLMRSAIHLDCEASCDEAVLLEANAEDRRVYGEVLIGMCVNRHIWGSALSTCFYSKKSNIKRRLDSIMDTKTKRKHLSSASIAIVLILTLLSGSIVAFAAPAKNNFIGVSKAKKIALTNVGLAENVASFIKAKLDRDDGRYVYDIEFYNGNTEYDYEIDAVNGSILEKDWDIKNYSTPKPSGNTGGDNSIFIGEAKAKEIALNHSGILDSSIRRIKCSLDKDDGRWEYEIEFVVNGIEYEYDIDATNGNILKSESEID